MRSDRVFTSAAALVIGVLGCGRDADSPTGPAGAPEPAPSVAEAAASTLVFSQVSTDDTHTCGITTDNLAYCWGHNGSGELGDGTPNQYTTLVPVAVAGGHRFRQVSAGGATCAVTTSYRAYCWGEGAGGALGNGTETPTQLTPVPVSGGLQFLQVEAGEFHTCGVTYPDRRAYCWGENQLGELGDGTSTRRLVPVLVAGGHRFREVSPGRFHTCGVTTSDQAYCWGWNNVGQIGDGTDVPQRLRPTLVAGGHAFRQLDAGSEHNCAVTTTQRAFCWGSGRFGEIGDGKTYLRYTPRAVAGGLSFDRVSAGNHHTCGETQANLAYCWGYNGWGALGDGTTTQRLTPVRVAGGLSFAQLSAGGFHTCGKTPAGVAWCWGDNFYGQLGDGTQATRQAPVPVAGPM